MAAEQRVPWETCSEPDCSGSQLKGGQWCLAHLATKDPDAFDAELTRIAKQGTIDARGVQLDAALLTRLLDAAPRATDRPLIRGARFERATFQGDVGFAGATFQGDAGFHGATFQGVTWFDEVTFQGGITWFDKATFHDNAAFNGVTFQGDAMFVEVTFQGDAEFNGATFHDDAEFGGATFQGSAEFDEAAFHGDAEFDGVAFQGSAGFAGTTFHRDAEFYGATFQGDAEFNEATFQGGAEFGEATFQGDARFHEAAFHDDAEFDETAFQGGAEFHKATFQGDAVFGGAAFQGDAGFAGVTFQGDAGFEGVVFEAAREFGPVLVHRGLDLDRARFTEPVQVEAAALGVCCHDARFAGGVQFRLRWARVVLDDTDLAAPCILAGIPGLADERLADREERIARAWRRLLGEGVSPRPRLLSLRRANVAGLSLADVDLADCRFGGTHNLDQLRFEADVGFGLAPARLAWDWRQVIADECAWRAARHTRGWTAPVYPAWMDEWLGQRRPSVLAPAQIAGLYRALRKAREDAKDEPGAADFYYGEMEMRRHARRGRTSGASRGRVERGVLTAYWLVSGYGLRAWRALASLAIVTAAFTVTFQLIGFARPPQPDSYWSSLLYAFRSTLSLTDNEVQLTAWGRLLQALLRITGPLLLGLALLAIRGRVKR
jgi:hypothetical protein